MGNLKNSSPLVAAVLALDEQFLNLTQLAARIETQPLKTDSDVEQLEHLVSRFAEIGAGVSIHIGTLSTALNAAREQAEAAAQKVAEKANQLRIKKSEIDAKMQEFQVLGEKVSRLSASLADLKLPEGQTFSPEERQSLSNRLGAVEEQLVPLIDEARQLQLVAQQAKIKTLEHGADSMHQSLLAVKRKIGAFRPGPSIEP